MSIEFNCPHCQRQYRVADTSAGKLVKCKQCANSIRIPASSYAAAPAPVAPAKPAMPAPRAAVASPAPNRPVFDDESDVGAYDLKEDSRYPARAINTPAPASSGTGGCPSCHAPLQPGAVICVSCGLNFQTGEKLGTSKVAAPVQRTYFGGSGFGGSALRASGNVVTARDGVAFPECCVKCGKDATSAKTRTYSWAPSWIYLISIVISPIIGAIIFYAMRKRIRITYFLCPQHARNVWIYKGVAFLICLALALGVIGATSDQEGAAIALGIFFAIVALIVVVAVGNPLRMTSADDNTGDFKGCGREFIKQL